ncbi:hypothetical protein J4218_04520 [Candidatus Pacearchaeota archaeon]|nr:hypothetical protein [Candidatus Pacearchaeota archaeon]
MRIHEDSKLIAYCAETSEEVLKRMFPRYTVTSFNEYEFFESGDIGKDIPLLGIGISGTDQFSGIRGVEITGNLEEMLKLARLVKLKRARPVNPSQVRTILRNVCTETFMHRISKEYNQWKYDTEQIAAVLKPYSK